MGGGSWGRAEVSACSSLLVGSCCRLLLDRVGPAMCPPHPLHPPTHIPAPTGDLGPARAPAGGRGGGRRAAGRGLRADRPGGGQQGAGGAGLAGRGWLRQQGPLVRRRIQRLAFAPPHAASLRPTHHPPHHPTSPLQRLLATSPFSGRPGGRPGRAGQAEAGRALRRAPAAGGAGECASMAACVLAGVSPGDRRLAGL